jgi:ankyrin repeat protein
MLAAAEGHVHVARYLLKVGAAPCGQDKFGGTALEDAVRAKDLAMVKMLVAHGVALNLESSSSMNPACEMCFAAASGDIEKVRILLEAKVSP